MQKLERFLRDSIVLLSDESRRRFKTILNQWMVFLEKPLHKANIADALTFLNLLRKRNLSDNTVKNRLDGIATMYRRLHDSGMMAKNPMAALRRFMPKRQMELRRQTRMLSKDQVLAIINAPDEASFKGIQDRAMLALLFGAGLRRSEITMLNLNDVNIEHSNSTYTGYVIISRAKSGKRQRQPFGDWVLDALTRLMTERRATGAEDNDPLFVTTYKGGGRISPRTIARRFQSYCKEAGIEGWIAPHSARATAASHLLDIGLGDRDVQLFLRHATTDMVRVYDKRRRELSDNPARFLVYSK